MDRLFSAYNTAIEFGVPENCEESSSYATEVREADGGDESGISEDSEESHPISQSQLSENEDDTYWIYCAFAWCKVCGLLHELPRAWVANNEVLHMLENCEDSTLSIMNKLYELRSFTAAEELGSCLLNTSRHFNEHCEHQRRPRLQQVRLELVLLKTLGDCQRELQKFDKAEDMFVEALCILKKLDRGDRSLWHAEMEANLAGLYHRTATLSNLL